MTYGSRLFVRQLYCQFELFCIYNYLQYCVTQINFRQQQHICFKIWNWDTFADKNINNGVCVNI